MKAVKYCTVSNHNYCLQINLDLLQHWGEHCEYQLWRKKWTGTV